MPEIEGDKLYNTCTIWGPDGTLIAKHRKVHLFDIDIPNKITFRESDSLSPGNSLTTFDVKGCKIGIGICYDIRFEEMARIYRNKEMMECGPCNYEVNWYSVASYFLLLWVMLPNADISSGIQYDHWTTALVITSAFQSE
ncbi:omega-amidase NIT2-A-like isoform X1 [Bombus vancouverensis nearcticus]|uniref:omega-amidase NIT2-A-like isoform X1 n=1 Tax=Bombus vancouverensis nearcticus TaxID=2705178 RepID=UPI00402B9EDE